MALPCFDCAFLLSYRVGDFTSDKLKKCCAHCNKVSKFDLICNLPSKQKNVGKKSTYFRRYGVAVQSLRSSGKSIRDIAQTLGISPTSVQKILSELGFKS